MKINKRLIRKSTLAAAVIAFLGLGTSCTDIWSEQHPGTYYTNNGETVADYLSGKERQCLDKWIEYCRDKDSLKELSPESHDAAYEAAWQAYQDDPQKGEMTLIEIARAGGASEKLVTYIRDKELMNEQFS